MLWRAPMQRRRFLTLVVCSSLAWFVPTAVRSAVGHRRTLQCHVAGVKYQGVVVSSIRTGQGLLIRRSCHGNEPCYEVQTKAGMRLGYIPRTLLPMLGNRKIQKATVANVNQHAVPWKQIEIALHLH